MRALTLLIFILSYFATLLAYGQSCENLFSEIAETTQPEITVEEIKSNSDRIELQKITNSPTPEKLTLEASRFSENVNQASIELMRLLLQNSSYVLEEKNVLTKGEFTLGIPVKDGYFFEVTYKSVSNERSQFIIEKISLKTPTGTDSKKLAEGILKANEVSIKKAEFDLQGALGEGIHAKLKIPLVIDGALLTKLDTLAKFFEYFSKEEMRKLLKTDSMAKIRWHFEYRHARDIFKKILFKEPMKMALTVGIFLAVTGNIPSFNKVETPAPAAIEAIAPSVLITDRINHFNIPKDAQVLKTEINNLNLQVRSYFKPEYQYSGSPKSLDIQLDYKNIFSQQHQTWVFEKADPYNKSIHTYIVFSEEKASSLGPAIQYMVMEIDAAKYPELIKYIKNQGQI